MYMYIHGIHMLREILLLVFALPSFSLFQDKFVTHFQRPVFYSTRKLIRSENCLPTVLLNVAGACIVRPSLLENIKSVPFLSSLAITQTIMASSMVMNDIFDLPVDRVNNPDRPLVQGLVSVRYATFLAVGLIGVAELINLKFIPYRHRYITHMSAALAVLYTPVCKHVFLLKNISCALLVSCSILFSGLAIDVPMNRLAWSKLVVACRLIFLGSVSNEILLDINDTIGDAERGIYTLPVLFGDDAAWNVAYSTMYFNILLNMLDITHSFNAKNGFIFLCICYPTLLFLLDVQTQNYNRNSVFKHCKKSMVPMAFALFFLTKL